MFRCEFCGKKFNDVDKYVKHNGIIKEDDDNDI